MKIIGDKLQKARISQDITIDKASNDTKIRRDYIIALEKEDFSNFKSHVYAKGFLKNYAKYLGLDENSVLAVYRRDYENFSISRIPKKKEENEGEKVKEDRKKLRFTSKQIGITFFIAILVIVIIIVLNLINTAFKPPFLKVNFPVELTANSSQSIDYFDNTLVIKGQTAPNTSIKINEIPLNLTSGFNFESEAYPITKDTNDFIITATSQLGVSSTIDLKVNKKIKAPVNLTAISGSITIINNDTNLVVKSDDSNIIFNATARVDDSFPVTAKAKLEIIVQKPESVQLILNNNPYTLTKSDETFTVDEKGNIKQSEN